MRFKLVFNLENEEIPIQYRKNIISFFKKALEEYDEKYFEKYYKKEENIIKPYTFAVYLKRPRFKEKEITVPNKELILNVSVADLEAGVILYNSFNNQRNKKSPMNKNSMTLINISMVSEKKILGDKIKIKFMSPLVVLEKNQETNKDYFYSFESEKFLDILKINIKNQIKETDISLEKLENFKIIPIEPKKTVVKFYEKQIETSLGIFELQGDKELLKYLYQSGMGSKHAAGFGMFEII